MTTSLVVERSEPGCGLPLPSASRMFIILAGVEGEPSWGPAFHMGWRPASSSSTWRRRVFTSLHFFLQWSAAACLAPWLGWLWCQLQRCLLPLTGAWLSVYRTGDNRAVRRSATSTASPVPPAALFRHRPEGRTRHRMPWGWRPRSWMVLSSLHRRARARTSSCVVRRPPSPVSHRCRGSYCRRC
jgi:hypothetical protein